MSDHLSQRLKDRAQQVEIALGTCLADDPSGEPALTTLYEAVRHGTLNGGKRLRPFLVLETAAMLGATDEMAMPAACAIEMIHSYSLIHDDLPAMDDADLRRGKPSVHAAYDEAIAILAGDGLLTDAFTVISNGPTPPDVTVKLIRTLSEAAGSLGMVGGQMMDLYPEAMTANQIIAIQRRKTGALIEAGAVMGGIVGQADEGQLDALRQYARALGLAFQIVDDVLDVTQSAEVLGKPANADKDAGKATFVSLLGLEGSRQRIDELTVEAKVALEPFGAGARWLKDLAQTLADRTH